ncbi:hypothetical protein ACHWQZ_G002335 [Mnemiopsis leidyi]
MDVVNKTSCVGNCRSFSRIENGEIKSSCKCCLPAVTKRPVQVLCEDGEIKETMYEDIESCSCEACPHDTETELPSMRQSLLRRLLRSVY